MSRFAGYCRVMYVDPPDFATPGKRPVLEERQGMAGLRVIRPLFPRNLFNTPGHSYQELWLCLLPDVLAEVGTNTILWVFSPRADYLVAAALPEIRLAVYDCMDDLASFRDGTQDLYDRETHLLRLVDLLFTGGRSMYEARKHRHARAYCFPSGVDIGHYAQVMDPAMKEAPALAGISHPRLGYFGVLDERIDWDLIGAIAESRPEWQWVLVGPTAKVEPRELPAVPNIHYLGHQPYSALPSFLKGFDIATMPFALNQATKFISPTKTLEYLAGGKPVISSSVPDVVASYKDIVDIADGADAWIHRIEQTLAAPQQAQQARRDRATGILAQSTWDSIADRMWTLMEEELKQKSDTAARADEL